MSFRVNNNIAAMNALRNVNQTGSEFGRAINRLSTGLRISSAADDPAGLIISENFRAQISSLEQAVRNNQDAVNFAKTAEGALDEVNRLLRDARSLAVASGNSATLSSEQLQANQSQLNSIVSSITRISTSTAFGTKKRGKLCWHLVVRPVQRFGFDHQRSDHRFGDDRRRQGRCRFSDVCLWNHHGQCRILHGQRNDIHDGCNRHG